MNTEFWQQKWQQNKIGFNQSQPNPLLQKHLPALSLPELGTVFVPLCGKSIDMLWLTTQNLNVVGVELVEQAVIDFFAENQITATIQPHPSNANLKYYQGTHNGCTITLWVGDIFELTSQDIGTVDASYDRAALVALPDNDNTDDPSDTNENKAAASLRVRYTRQLMALTNDANQLLLTFGLGDDLEYTYDNIAGPPFFIAKAKIYDYYIDHYSIAILEQQQSPNTTLKDRPFWNIVWILRSKL